ncbi:MAG: alpha/beta hydrolase, partial [Acidobacteria bacterium]|nr:alpha/beta hydrolase [Acidobacteriota bacterium]
MNRREWFFAAVGLVLLSLSTFFLLRERIPAREVVLAQACGTPIRIMTPPANKDAPAAIVLHGLGANAVVMRSLGQFLANMGFRVYLLDLPGHGNNRERFSLMRAGECTVQTISLLERLGEIRLDHTVLIGHSMGGALAIRMADYFPAAATVAISPAPMIHTSSMPAGAVLMGPPHRMPVNLLIMMGQFDFPYSRESAEKLVQMGGGQRDAPEDFLEKRALKLVTVPRATHTSLIFDLPNDSPLATWLHKSLPENVRPQVVNAIKPELWGILGLLGLAFLFPLAASSTVFALGLKHVPPTVAGKSAKSAALFWLVAGLFAVSALKLFPQD